MAMTNVELYEALRRTIPEEAARMIAEVVPPARDLATKADLSELRAEMHAGFADLRGQIADGLAGLRGDLAAVSRLQQWMLGFFVPVWVGTFGTLIAVVLKA